MFKNLTAKMSRPSARKGFTLIELVIVILIIGILAVVLIPQLSTMTNKAKTSGVQEAFREYQIAAQTVGYEQSGFAALMNEANAGSPAVGTEGEEGYVPAVPAKAANEDAIVALNANLDAVNEIATDGTISREDPWGNAYTVTFDSAADSVTFTSAGADGVTGNADDLSTTVSYDAGSVLTETAGFSLNA